MNSNQRAHRVSNLQLSPVGPRAARTSAAAWPELIPPLSAAYPKLDLFSQRGARTRRVKVVAGAQDAVAGGLWEELAFAAIGLSGLSGIVMAFA